MNTNVDIRRVVEESLSETHLERIEESREASAAQLGSDGDLNLLLSRKTLEQEALRC